MRPLLVVLALALAGCGLVTAECPSTSCAAGRHAEENDDGSCVCVADEYDDAPGDPR